MKVRVVKCEDISGISKEAGNKFQFHRLTVLQPMEKPEGAKFRKRGSGLDVVEIDCSEDAFRELAQLGDEEFPVWADIDVEMRGGGSGRPSKLFATGAKLIKATTLKAAA